VTDEIPLSGGALTEGVVRVGDTVRRPATPKSELIRDVLRRLEEAGFSSSPRCLGVDDCGRDVLSWIEGETFADRSLLHPYIGDPPGRIEFSDGQLAAAFGLLRTYHDTLAGDLVCHGDFGPWNLVWREGKPIGIIDFDNVHRGDASEDVAYALRTFISYGLVEDEPAELVRRTRVALGAYGAEFDAVALLEWEYDRAEADCRRNGWLRALARIPAGRAWLVENRALF
jgi:hypothetical protein